MLTQDDVNFLQAVANLLATRVEAYSKAEYGCLRKQGKGKTGPGRTFQPENMPLISMLIVAATDRFGTITYVNDKFCEISKYSREELIGQNHRIINSGLSPQGVLRQPLEDHFVRSCLPWRDLQPSQRWLSILGRYDHRSLQDEQGRVREYVAVRADITERKRVEQALRQSEDQLRSITDATPRSFRISMLISATAS